jgi:uncharacterized membrane protein
MAQPTYTLYEAPPSVAGGWFPVAINDDDVVVGTIFNPYTYVPQQAVIWDAGGGGLPTVLPYDPCGAFAINNHKQLVGAYPYPNYLSTPLPLAKAFLYTSGPPAHMTDLSEAVGVPTYATAINNDGLITGNAGEPTGVQLGSKKAFVYDSKTNSIVAMLTPPAGYISIYAVAINDQGHVVGTLFSAADLTHAFICRDYQNFQIFGKVHDVTGVNKHDVLTGMTLFKDGWRAFRLDASAADPHFEEVGPPNCDSSFSVGIKDDGTVVLNAFLTGQEIYRGFVDFPPTSPYAGHWKLEDVLTSAGWIVGANAINNNGQIVAQGSQGNTGGVVLLDLLPQQQPWQAYGKKAYGALVEFVMMFGGATVGAGGWGFYGRKFYPIPPRQDFIALWQRLPRPAQEALVGKAVQRFASLIDDPRRREALQRAALDLLTDTVGGS